MSTMTGAVPAGIRVVVEAGGARVLFLGRERIPLPGTHPGGPVPEARVCEDQDGNRYVLVGAERIPIPAGQAPDEAASPAARAALGGQAARVECDDDGRCWARWAGQAVEIPRLSLTAQEADEARVLVDDAGRRILYAGPHRLVMAGADSAPPAPAPSPAAVREDPAMVIAGEDGCMVLLHAGRRTPLPGVRVSEDEACGARVLTDGDGRRTLVLGERQVPVDGGAERAAQAAAPAPEPFAAGPRRDAGAGTAAPEAAVAGGIAFAGPVPAPVARAAAAPAPDAHPRPPARFQAAEGDAAPELNLRSEELQEIIGFIPHWLVRWGTAMVFATVLLLAAVAWVVRYPDVVSGAAVLTTPEPPVRLVPRTSGEVEHLFVSDGTAVRPGDPLLVLRSAARWQDVFALEERLARLEASLGDDAAVRAAAFDPQLPLGGLHAEYAAFLRGLSDYRSSASAGYHAGRVAELEGQIREQEQVRENTLANLEVLREQVELAGRERDRARAMAARELISRADVDRAEAEYLQRRGAVQDGQSAVARTEVQISSARAQLLEARRGMADEERNGVLGLRTALAALRGAIARWDQDNVLRAPAPGRVSLFRVLAPHQYVDAGTPLLAIVPEGGEAVGRVLLASAGAGKVEAGQRVLLRLESFPAREYGAVEGRVAHVAQLPQTSEEDEPQYLVEVALPGELVTTYRRRLPFRQEMRGEASIITRDRRLIARLFDQVRGSVDAAGG